MNSKSRQQGAGTGFVDIEAHLDIASNSMFPFSSPNIDDRSSVRSSHTEYYQHSQIPSESGSSTLYSTNDSNAFVRDKEELSSRMYGQEKTQSQKSQKLRSETRRVVQRNSRTGLRIVTKLPQTQPRPGQVTFNRVAAKPTGFSINRAHSILSHKGVSVLPSPLPLKMLARTRYSRKAVQETLHKSNVKQTPSSPARSSVVFGLCVPEHEAKFHGGNDAVQSAVTLVTPDTPMVINTPDDKPSNQSSQGPVNRGNQRPRQISPTSTYSRTVVLDNTRRHSSDSQQHMLPESCDTARPKSQGWWNLMLSPVMSRAGTLKSLKAPRNDTIPPVPAIPSSPERHLALQTPATVMSPITPRRLGIATIRTSTYSQETEWEDESDLSQEDISNFCEAVPASPREFLTRGLNLVDFFEDSEEFKGEGLAAEYFHACAIEQLANITYFECVNHSCADRLPQLCSVYDMQDKNSGPDGLAVDNMTVYGASGSHTNASQPVGDMDRSSPLVECGHSDSISHQKKPELSLRTKESLSPSITVVDTGEVVSPNLRQANTAKFSKAKAVKSERPSPAPSSAHVDPLIKHLNIQSVENIPLQPPVDSPGPISPEANRAIAPTGAMSMAPLQSLPANSTTQLHAPVPQQNHALVSAYQQPTTIIYYPYGQAGPYPVAAPPIQQYPTSHVATPPLMRQVNQHEFDASTISRQPLAIVAGHPPINAQEYKGPHTESIVRSINAEEDDKKSGEDDETKSEKTKKIKSKTKEKKGCFGVLCCCFGRGKTKNANHRRRNIIIAAILIIVVILCILFAILFTRGSGAVGSIESQWLNLTGYPPIPTGISTIAQPNLSASQNQCVQPSTMWSCSLPREEQASVSPNEPNQPNFRFQILFKNGTVPSTMSIPLNGRASDSSTDVVPNPSPPTQLDQIFLGNTTDNVTKPFDGEATPFFITFMAAISDQAAGVNATNNLLKRQSDTSDPLNSIPAPSIGGDGMASPASLLPTTPFPISQPIKLYNRGLADEHYGFYTYFDKSIFLSGVVLGDTSAANNSLTPLPADQNGGSTKLEANVRCTWSQTRFIVKMYTNPAFGASLLSGGAPVNVTNTTTKDNKTSSAKNFIRPGSFPYPTTISLDRHGGDINKKLLYCYGQRSGLTVRSSKILVAEVRSFGGVLVNPSPRLLNDPANPGFDSSIGGIDGGTGGCGCRWQNWS